MDQFIAFAFNANVLQLPFQLFFFFFFLVQFSGQTVKSFLGNFLRLVIKEAFEQDLNLCLDTPNNISVRFVPQVTIRDTCDT